VVASSRVEIVAVDDEAEFWADRNGIRACLLESPPRVLPWFGYDALGSQLFEEITELPTYFLTRVERALLETYAGEIADLLGCGQLTELGSGSAKKTRLLLAACVERRPTTYLPIDVSREMLVATGDALTADLAGLRVRGLWGRYEAALAHLRDHRDHRDEPVAVAFLGSNLGNTTPAERTALLAEITATLRPGDRFLVSVDLQKPAAVFEACYNDPLDRSAFARFRLNHLTHLNRRFDCDFVLHRFYPRAHYNAATGEVEGHVYATEAQTVLLRDLELVLDLQRGDSINVGISAKFHRPTFVAEVNGFGFTLDAEWIDAVWQYGIFLFVRD
jgi:L-histidine N-alpha-methyltransferase